MFWRETGGTKKTHTKKRKTVSQTCTANMFMYENVSRSLQFCLHVCVLVRLVATRDKYTCASAAGCSLDCASGSQIRAVIFHICARPTRVHLEGRFYVEKVRHGSSVCLCMFTVCTAALHISAVFFPALFSSGFSASLFVLGKTQQQQPCVLFPSLSLRLRDSLAFTCYLSEQMSCTFGNWDGKTFSLHFHR